MNPPTDRLATKPLASPGHEAPASMSKRAEVDFRTESRNMTERYREPNIRTMGRYRISDPECGIFATWPKKQEAIRAAELHYQERRCDDIRVTDTMAGYNRAREWNRLGNALSHRPSMAEELNLPETPE